MKKENSVIVRIKAGSEEVRNFEDSYSEHCECLSNYKHYNITAPREIKLLADRLEKNHLYYMLAAVYDGSRVKEAYWGCGQFIKKKGFCGFRLFVKAKSEYDSMVKDILELAGTDSDIAVISSEEIAERIGSVVNGSVDGRIKEICIA